MRFIFNMKTQGTKVISAINESYVPVLMKRDALIPVLVSAFSMLLAIFQVGEDFGFCGTLGGFSFKKLPFFIRCPYIRVAKYREACGVWETAPLRKGTRCMHIVRKVRKFATPRILMGEFFSEREISRQNETDSRVKPKSPLVFEKEGNSGFTF